MELDEHTMENKISFYRGLRGAVGILASNDETQVAHLNPDHAGPDELALAFDDHYRPVGQWCAELGVSDQAAEALAELDVHLSSFHDDESAELWTFEALKDSAQWRAVRVLAAQAFALLDEK